MHKTIEKVVDVPRKSRAEGFSIAQLNRRLLGELMDPYLMFDHFHMARPFFPPHPHAGFSAVTYMFPESENGFRNRDSLGNVNEIHPGAIHWTVAGHGVMHEEVPLKNDVICAGLQIFVNLHSSKKHIAPFALHAEPDEIPLVESRDATVRVVVGEYEGRVSPVKPPVDVLLYDCHVSPGGELECELPENYQGFLYVPSGRGFIGSPDARHEIRGGQAAGFGAAGRGITAAAAEEELHFVLGAGLPLREPAMFHGPFCMTTQEELRDAVARYEAGEMGSLEPSF